MKVVLLSIIIIITVVQVFPRCSGASRKYSTKTRRYIPIKEAAYSTRLSRHDRISKQLGQFELLEDRNRGRMIRKCRDRARHRKGVGFLSGHNSATFNNGDYETRAMTRRRPIAPALNFHSPEQLQEYLFSEAASAKHILRNGPALFTSSGHRPVAEEYSTEKARAYAIDPVAEFDHAESGGLHHKVNRSASQQWIRHNLVRKNSNYSPERDAYDSVWRTNSYYPVPERYREPKMPKYEGLDYLTRRSHPPPSVPYGIPELSEERRFSFRNKPPPYDYPPDWYGFRSPPIYPRKRLTYPYDRKLYESPSHSSMKKAKKDDMAVGNEVAKLKQMVDELDALSEEVKESAGVALKGEGEKNNDTIADAKYKIDKVVIPLLSEISKELLPDDATTERSSTTTPKTTTHSTTTHSTTTHSTTSHPSSTTASTSSSTDAPTCATSKTETTEETKKEKDADDTTQKCYTRPPKKHKTQKPDKSKS
ncbi:UNVERIFIED_CONTAM: hypothetical protein PYX00_001110 [Menopon gallinae]|uniref:Uncharacterized protein n=1 Tax=Menopon gallinae TaxID=328185 RepID=A0AAW2IBB7_9NEOP